jgi:hypothetical protein
MLLNNFFRIKVNDPYGCVSMYMKSEQRWRHTAEIRSRYRYIEFAEKGSRFRLGRILCALCWTGTDRPGMLFDHAVDWLSTNKILLPGITVLERFVAEIRSRMESRLWRMLIKNLSASQQEKLTDLLVVEDDQHLSLLDKLRKGPVRQEGFPVFDEDVARLSAYGYGHINMLGRYSFAMPDEVKRGELRPLRTTEKS